MGHIVLYLAMSVDGYIADKRDGVSWRGGGILSWLSWTGSRRPFSQA